MTVGDSALESLYSHLMFGRETAFGTAVTATAALNFLSGSPKISQPEKILEEITRNRVYSKRIKMGKTVEFSSEGYFYANDTACNWILQHALGGSIVSSTATGEIVGGLGFEHIYSVGNIADQTYTALTLQARKGDSASGKVFEYTGQRVSEYSLSAELDDALKFSSSFVGKDFTSTATDQASNIGVNTSLALSFVNGRVSVENSFGSLTSSSFWHVQSFNLAVANSLKSDAESRRIGTDTLDVLPTGMQSNNLTMNLRFNTTTALDAMIAGTKLSVELEFLGNTMAGSNTREGVKFQMPAVYIDDAGDPEIGGPDEILQSEVSSNVLRDESSAAGYALRAIVTNLTANYD